MQSSMRAIASLLIASLISLHVSALEAAAQQTVEQQATVQRAVQSADSPALTRQYVSQLPIGTVVKIDLVSGEKLTATLMIVNQADVVVKPKTRVAEAARTLPYESILRIEPKGQGSSVAKAVAIGAGIGAATFFGILLFAISVSD